MKNRFKKIALVVTIGVTITLSCNLIYAVNEENIFIPCKKSKAQEQWEKLSDEERANAVQPLYFDTPFKESIKRSTYLDLINNKLGATLESTYKRGNLTIKNQQKTNMCWAFAFSSILEGSGAGKVYSPAYLDYKVSSIFNKKQGDAGNYYISLGAATSGLYPVTEEKLPFSSVYNESTNTSTTYYMTPADKLPSGSLNKSVDARITDATLFATINKSIDSNGTVTYTDGTNTYDENGLKSARALIKEHIKNEGPIGTMMYSDLAYDSNYNFISRENFTNPDTGAVFCNDSGKQPNHAVIIVGWDDNYEVSNFNANNQPSTPGAYIIQNSYGTGVGKNGYMYVSYEDLTIENNLVGINNLEEYSDKEEIKYKNIYQHDELGYNYSIMINANSALIANVFSKEGSDSEFVNEVGIYLPSAEGVEIYMNPASDDKSNLTQVAVSTDNITAGYHVIKLSSPVKITGNKFVVAAKLTNREDKPQIPLETNWKDSNITFTSNFFDTATANPGESFISVDNGSNWIDIDGMNVGAVIKLKNTNVCLKAYTISSLSTVDVTGVSLNRTSYTMNVEDKVTLEATVLPTNATNKKVVWTSSDSSVATVANGVVTGIKEGTATITATTEDGNKTATCEITVNAKSDATIAVTGVSLNKTTMTLNVEDKATLEATVLPTNATNKKVVWTSSDSSVAIVTNGVVTGVKEGTARITVTTEDGNKNATCEIAVTAKSEEQNPKPGKVDTTGVKLNVNIMNLEVGDKGNLVATITPTNATNQEVTWTSSDTSVATISETGIITALKEGKTTITVKTEDGGYTAACVLTVKAKTNTADDIYKDDSSSAPVQTADKETSNSKNSVTNGKNTDTTVANTILPNTGKVTFIIIGCVLLISIVVIGIKARSLKDVK